MRSTNVVLVSCMNGKLSGLSSPMIARGASSAMCRSNTTELPVRSVSSHDSRRGYALNSQRMVQAQLLRLRHLVVAEGKRKGRGSGQDVKMARGLSCGGQSPSTSGPGRSRAAWVRAPASRCRSWQARRWLARDSRWRSAPLQTNRDLGAILPTLFAPAACKIGKQFGQA